jgi:hypothetical protein
MNRLLRRMFVPGREERKGGKKEKEGEESCVMRIFTNCILRKVFLGWSNRGEWNTYTILVTSRDDKRPLARHKILASS